jgi:hypothetical protein
MARVASLLKSSQVDLVSRASAVLKGIYACCAIFCCAHAHSAEVLSRVGTIQVPGTSAQNPFEMFDNGLIAPSLDRYFLSDITNKSVDVFRASTGQFLFRVPGFFGYSPPCCERVGPGSLEIVGEDELWVTDADSAVKIVSLAARKVVETISTGGRVRTDALAYDPRDHVMVVNNPDDPIPFITFISVVAGHPILGKLQFPRATASLEHAVWSAKTGLYYLTIPELDANHARGGLAVIDPRKRTVLRTIPIDRCGPNAVALGPDEQLLIGCRAAGRGNDYGFPPGTFVMNLRTEKIDRLAPVNGSDQAWYNPGDNRYYLAALANRGGPVVAAIEASGEHRVITATSQHFAHSVAVDPRTNHAFVPFSATPTDPDCLHGCIAVYAVTGDEVAH